MSESVYPPVSPAPVGGAAEGHVRILVLTASLRTDSLNARLADLVAAKATKEGVGVETAHLRDYPMPLYNGDVEHVEGPPEGAVALRARLQEVNGFVIASPEYNASFPGALKNAIDWVSRFRPQPFKDKQGLLVSASTSLTGGNRGLWALRVPLEHLGARIYPDMFSLAAAHQAFNGDGLVDPGLDQRLEDTVNSFLHLVEADTHYPCLRRRWYEFLSDRTDAPDTQRTEG